MHKMNRFCQFDQLCANNDKVFFLEEYVVIIFLRPSGETIIAFNQEEIFYAGRLMMLRSSIKPGHADYNVQTIFILSLGKQCTYGRDY